MLSHPRLARLAAALLLPGVLCGVGQAADEVVWAYPRPQSLITESPVAVYGYLTGPPQVNLDANVVGADGAALPQRVTLNTFKGKVFTGSIPLTRGRNNIVVAGAVLPLFVPAGRRPGRVTSANPSPTRTRSSPASATRSTGERSTSSRRSRTLPLVPQAGAQAERAALKKTKRSQEVTPDCLRCHEAHTAFEPKLKSDDGLCSACHPGSAYAGLLPRQAARPRLVHGLPRRAHLRVSQDAQGRAGRPLQEVPSGAPGAEEVPQVVPQARGGGALRGLSPPLTRRGRRGSSRRLRRASAGAATRPAASGATRASSTTAPAATSPIWPTGRSCSRRGSPTGAWAVTPSSSPVPTPTGPSRRAAPSATTPTIPRRSARANGTCGGCHRMADTPFNRPTAGCPCAGARSARPATIPTPRSSLRS